MNLASKSICHSHTLSTASSSRASLHCWACLLSSHPHLSSLCSLPFCGFFQIFIFFVFLFYLLVQLIFLPFFFLSPSHLEASSLFLFPFFPPWLLSIITHITAHVLPLSYLGILSPYPPEASFSRAFATWIFSRVLRDFTPRYVSRLVGWSVGCPFTLFLNFWAF